MKSKSFARYSKKDKNITYTPMFNKNFVEKITMNARSNTAEKSLETIIELKGERLKVFSELMRYPEYHAAKGCLRARFKSILDVSTEIVAEIQTLQSSLTEDEKWLSRLNGTLSDLWKTTEKSSKNNEKKHLNLAWQDFYICCRVCEVLCCCQISVHQIKRKIRAKLHLYTNREIIALEIFDDETIALLSKNNPSGIAEYLKPYVQDNLAFGKEFSKENLLITEEKKNGKNEENWNEGDDEFTEEMMVFERDVFIGNKSVFVKVYCHPMILSTKFVVFDRDKKVFYDFENVEIFEMLKNLQFRKISDARNTVGKSLEFEYAIQLLINI